MSQKERGNAQREDRKQNAQPQNQPEPRTPEQKEAKPQRQNQPMRDPEQNVPD